MSSDYDMPSFRSLASAASRSIKGYVVSRESKRPALVVQGTGGENGTRQSWSQWAGQKLKQVQGGASGTESLVLFPGWATRRFHEAPETKISLEEAPFDVEVFMSGFASKSSGAGFNTRSGRAFLKIATTFAALPKLAAQLTTNSPPPISRNVSRSTEDLLKDVHLPAPPDEMDENAEAEELERRLRDLDIETASTASMATDASSLSYPSSVSSTSSGYGTPRADTRGPVSAAAAELMQKWNTNLQARLHPFWCSVLPARTVRISIFATDPSLEEFRDKVADDQPRRPLATQDVVTGPDGAFQVAFRVPWKALCTHPQGVQIASSDRQREHDLIVTADLMPPPSPRTPTATAFPQQPLQGVDEADSTVTALLSVPLTYTTVRVISDIDDTVKLAIFQNVFVKDLDESIIPGMAEWYMNMWTRGVRFHYVVGALIHWTLCRLPPGSIKLRSYAGRSLFSGLLSAPAARKRASVLDVVNSFPDARFVCVGDSGEQDLELYASIAKEKPAQVLAIFIRDVSADSGLPPLDDPTGVRVLRMEKDPQQGNRPVPVAISRRPSSRKGFAAGGPTGMARSISGMDVPVHEPARKPARMHSDNELLPGHHEPVGYFTSTSPTTSPLTEEPEDYFRSTHSSPQLRTGQDASSVPSTPPGSRQTLSEPERRRLDYQSRVWRARLEAPEHIPLRIFRRPDECMEAHIILEGLLGRREENNLMD
ncbi:uncharacterized protein B0H18DRAFT_1083048 [Fomitopsis serialis]|uniref:uncharacterized protein n=1 Tax=Fomitopsis serialis TaxID=139415 RepID=UPI0020075E12|nr:uncharacterized protein B0H18DRAFT_1083048 [Neoantrodia serialis]KAH9933390.1 hypothetical protein B0H18DRAFT_1083048 [Neoantrodia serialis]